VYIWDTASGQRLHTLPGHAAHVFTAAFSPDGRFLATSGDDSSREGLARFKMWDLTSGRLAFEADPFTSLGEAYFCLAYTADGRRLLATGRNGGKICVWDTANGKKIGVMADNSRRTIFSMALSPNNRYLACAAQGGKIQIWDGRRTDELQTGVREIGSANGYTTDALAFTPDNSRIAAGDGDDTAAIWDVESGAKVLPFRAVGHGFRALAFSPDGRWMASGGLDCVVHIWDAASGKLLLTFRGHRGPIVRLSFVAPDGQRLVSGSQDRTVKMWDLRVVKN
jgi:WD40 repeat protein